MGLPAVRIWFRLMYPDAAYCTWSLISTLVSQKLHHGAVRSLIEADDAWSGVERFKEDLQPGRRGLDVIDAVGDVRQMPDGALHRAVRLESKPLDAKGVRREIRNPGACGRHKPFTLVRFVGHDADVFKPHLRQPALHG